MNDSLEQVEEAKNQEVIPLTYTVDSFNDGISFGQHKLEPGRDPRDFYRLRLKDEKDLVPLRSRYSLHKENPLIELEKNLMRLSGQGVLHSSIIYFGTCTDPFFPFDGKFDASMRFLEIFQKYTPGKLVVQTRSPLVVIAMPVFTKLGKHASVTFGLETHLDDVVEDYTPGLPRVEERLKAVRALRKFGIEVTLQASPILPYGDWRKDARNFAEVLVENSDYIHASAMSDGSEQVERRLRSTLLAQRLARNQKYHWLRPDTARPLLLEIEKLAPEKLRLPEWRHLKTRQLKMFAA